jgi:molecular chaperone GrpE (heat shock protein)
MSEQGVPRVSKWPFFLGDLLLLGAAVALVEFGKRPVGLWESAALIACVALGALFGVWPFLRDHDAELRLAESDSLNTTVAKIQQLEKVAGQISSATGMWQSALDQSQKTVTAADSIATRMNAEQKDFIAFMQKANDSEKATLRLEVDKLRRTESDWLQVIVRMLDHTYALYQAAVNSGQPHLVQQLGNFQFALRDAARRIGLAPFVPAPNEPFDPKMHQPADEKTKPEPDAVVVETIATGFTYQGQMLRPALVALQTPGTEKADEAPKPDEPRLL